VIPGVDTADLIRTAGYLGLFAIVFAETGLLVGFFLPGDSLLFTAGFLASQGALDIRLLILVTFAAAVIGDTVGYTVGHRVGRGLYRREDSYFFRRTHLARTEALFARHGGKVIVLARVIPFARTFAPVVAGVGAMPYGKFVVYNVGGGLAWTAGLSLMGYFLGAAVPHADRYLLPAVLLVIALSVAPGAFALARASWPQLRSAWRSHRGPSGDER